MAPPPLRLDLDGAALVANWRALAAAGGGAACGAAVKADGYGLGAGEVVRRLAAAGCRDFFVATWAEAEALGELPGGVALSVLHGVRAADMAAAVASSHRPVLNSPEQVARWRGAGGGPCDVMIDTGMNRLGLDPAEALSGLLDGIAVDTLMSHLACADEPGHPMNERQRAAFAAVAARIPARRASLANSAGIALGPAYHLDLTRPGIGLHGGIDGMARVVRPMAEVLQVRRVPAGSTVGYGADWTAPADSRVAILNLGYADGYARAFFPGGHALAGDRSCPVAGRVSMDLVAVVVPDHVGEGDWLEIGYDLARAAAATGLSRYELLTGLGRRYQRRWT